jgi:carbonic anhydrase
MFNLSALGLAFAGSACDGSQREQAPRTAKSDFVPASEALARLREGNERFVAGEQPRVVQGDLRRALAEDGQLPMAAVLGCADSRCPVELLFGAMPGDIFVCRNAGNTVTHAEGSVVASLEYAMCHLQTKLILVLGHTKCGAIKGAVASLPAASDHSPGTSVLQDYLVALTPVAQRAKDELPEGASEDEVSTHAVRVNVQSTVERILQYSSPLRERVEAGEVLMLGAIYDITTGRVEFLADEAAEPAEEPRRSQALPTLLSPSAALAHSAVKTQELKEMSGGLVHRVD